MTHLKQILTNFRNWINVNQRILFIGFVLLLMIIITATNIHSCKKKPTAVDNPILDSIIDAQNKRINELEISLSEVTNELNEKKSQDSILSASNITKIISLQQGIAKLKIDNEKKHIIISNSNLEQSYDALRTNIKARKKH